MIEIKLKFNPATSESEFYYDGQEMKHGDWEAMWHKRPIDYIKENGSWPGIFKKLNSDFKNDQMRIIFDGPILDYQDLINEKNNLGDEAKNIELGCVKDSEVNETINKLKKWMEILKNYSIFKEKSVEEAYKESMEILDSPCDIYFVAKQSSGKSTLINSLLGKDILPADANQTTFAEVIIKYNENANQDSNKILESVFNKNKNKKNSEFSWNIPFLNGIRNQVNIIDTVGFDNIGFNREKYLNEIEKNKNAIVVYILSPNFDTGADFNDGDQFNNGFINQMRKIYKDDINGNISLQNRFIFVFNRVDEFHSQEEFEKSFSKAVKLLKDADFEGCPVIPTSALQFLGLHDPNGKSFAEVSFSFHDSQLHTRQLLNHSLNVPKVLLQRAEVKDDKDVLTGVPLLSMLLCDYINSIVIPAHINTAIRNLRETVERVIRNDEIAQDNSTAEKKEKVRLKIKELEKKITDYAKINGNPINNLKKDISKGKKIYENLSPDRFMADCSKKYEEANLKKKFKNLTNNEKIAEYLNFLDSEYSKEVEKFCIKELHKKIAEYYNGQYENLRVTFKDETIGGIKVFSSTFGNKTLVDTLASFNYKSIQDKAYQNYNGGKDSIVKRFLYKFSHKQKELKEIKDQLSEIIYKMPGIYEGEMNNYWNKKVEFYNDQYIKKISSLSQETKELNDKISRLKEKLNITDTNYSYQDVKDNWLNSFDY